MYRKTDKMELDCESMDMGISNMFSDCFDFGYGEPINRYEWLSCHPQERFEKQYRA